ncbi:hypothetical protein MPLB_2040037 [Mesorhizobium sp. ORS 3324]|nr:hypothetical protein MPLB_2040037 [Mesorhizobium sp. ORS 3324]
MCQEALPGLPDIELTGTGVAIGWVSWQVAPLSPIPVGRGTFEGTCTGLLHVMESSIEGILASALIPRGLWLAKVPELWLMRSEMDETAVNDPDL